jgi:hypothetical protein
VTLGVQAPKTRPGGIVFVGRGTLDFKGVAAFAGHWPTLSLGRAGRRRGDYVLDPDGGGRYRVRRGL